MKCDKCNKDFKSQYHLNKHINRKYPCTVIFKCIKCETVFDSNRILEKHMKRKTPCIDVVEVKQDVEIMRLELESRKLSIRERELDIKEKHIEAKRQELETKKELIELKKQAFIEKNTVIEKLKTERKEKTSVVINNNNTINITNNIVNHIKNNYSDNYDISAFKERLENTYGELTHPFDLKPFELMLKFYDNYTDDTVLFNDIMKFSFIDEKDRCLFYFKEIDKFFALYKDNDKNSELSVRETDFDKELKKPCESIVVKILNFIYNNIPTDKYKYEKSQKLLEYSSCFQQGFGSTRNLVGKFFEEEI